MQMWYASREALLIFVIMQHNIVCWSNPAGFVCSSLRGDDICKQRTVSSLTSVADRSLLIEQQENRSYNGHYAGVINHDETISALLAICAGNSPVPVSSPHKDQWRGALVFSLICVWINGWVNNRKAGDLRRYRAHYDVIVIIMGVLL